MQGSGRRTGLLVEPKSSGKGRGYPCVSLNSHLVAVLEIHLQSRVLLYLLPGLGAPWLLEGESVNLVRDQAGGKVVI